MIDHTGRSTNPSCWSGGRIWSESGWVDKRRSSSSSSSSRSLVATLTQENRSKEEKKAEDMVAATQAATWSSFSRERILRALLSVFSIRSEQSFSDGSKIAGWRIELGILEKILVIWRRNWEMKWRAQSKS